MSTGFALASVAVSSWLIFRAFRDWSAPSRWLLLATGMFWALSMARADFGQREHFAVLLTLPYLLSATALVAGRPIGGPAAWLVGVAGGLGFAIKPHFLACWLLIYAPLGLLGPFAAFAPSASPSCATDEVAVGQMSFAPGLDTADAPDLEDLVHTGGLV